MTEPQPSMQPGGEQQEDPMGGLNYFPDSPNTDFVRLMGDNSLLLHDLKMRLSGMEFDVKTESWKQVDLPQIPKEALQPAIGMANSMTNPISRFSQTDNETERILSKAVQEDFNDLILLSSAYQDGGPNFNINAWAAGATGMMFGVTCKMGLRQSVNALMLREVAGQHKTLRHIQNIEGKQTIKEESSKGGWFK
jgi:hypothetical protein